MDFCKKIISLILLVFGVNALVAQDWVSYQSPAQINDLVDTGTELHLATDAGLVVINKATLDRVVFDKSNSNLPSSHIQSVTRGPSGDTWIGTYDMRVARFDGVDFQSAETPEGIDNPLTNVLYDLKIHPNGDMWIGASEGVFHKQDGAWNRYDQDDISPDLFHVWDMEINAAGEVFAASNNLYKFSNGQWTDISGSTGLISAYTDAEIFHDSAGGLFFAGDLEKIGRFDGTQWQVYDRPDLGSNTVFAQIPSFTEDSNGQVYLNMEGHGLYKLVGDTWEPHTDTQTDAFDNKTSYFHIDDQGRRWLNWNIHLSVNDNGSVQSTLIADHTLEYNAVNRVRRGSDGKMYFITRSDKHISVRDTDGEWSLLPLPIFQEPFENFQDLLIVEDGMWLASNKGLHFYNGVEWLYYAVGSCSLLLADSQGKVYAQGAERIHIADGFTLSDYSSSNSPLSASFISGMGMDADDNLWVVGWGESVVQKVSPDGTWTDYAYTPTEHPSLDCHGRGEIHFDAAGTPWMASECYGAYRLDGATFTNPFEGQTAEMENPDVFAIQSDAMGKMYFSHQYGVTTWFGGQWGDLLIEEVPLNYSHAADMQFDAAGNLWWASSRYGVFAYATGAPTSAEAPALASALAFTLFPNPAADHITLDLELDQAAAVDVRIYNSTGQLVKQTDLGLRPEGGLRETLRLGQLPKGVYTLRVQAGMRFSTSKLVLR